MTTPPRDRDAIRREFEAIMMARDGGTRPVMSIPPAPIATDDFIREVADALNLDGDAAREAADWIVGKLDRYAAWHAEPVFDMDGAGPVCSYCKAIWPLCGHHHQSAALPDEEVDGQ